MRFSPGVKIVFFFVKSFSMMSPGNGLPSYMVFSLINVMRSAKPCVSSTENDRVP